MVMRKRQRAFEERDEEEEEEEEEEADQRRKKKEKEECSIVTSTGHINFFADLQTGVRLCVIKQSVL